MCARMMLKSMREAIGPDPMFGSDQEQMYQGMADDQLSIQLSKGKGLGLADMLVRRLQRMGVKGADAAANGKTAAEGAGAAGAVPIAPRGTPGGPQAAAPPPPTAAAPHPPPTAPRPRPANLMPDPTPHATTTH